MKPAPFAFVAPTTLHDTLSLLHEVGDEGKVLSGGQSLVPLLNMRFAVPAVVIDITRVSELRETVETPDGCRFGALTVHSAFEDRLLHDPTRGLLPTAAAGIGYRAVRNRGTLGGSLAHADSSAEWPVVMAALDATIIARSASGERSIPARSFVQGFFTNALADDEVLTEVRVPALSEGTHWGLQKTARKPGEFAESLAVVLVDEQDGLIQDAQAWLGAAGPVPLPIPGFATRLSGRRCADVERDDVLAAVREALEPVATAHDRYRVHLHGVTIWRALQQSTVHRSASRQTGEAA